MLSEFSRVFNLHGENPEGRVKVLRKRKVELVYYTDSKISYCISSPQNRLNPLPLKDINSIPCLCDAIFILEADQTIQILRMANQDFKGNGLFSHTKFSELSFYSIFHTIRLVKFVRVSKFCNTASVSIRMRHYLLQIIRNTVVKLHPLFELPPMSFGF